MKTVALSKRRTLRNEAGQAMLFTVLALGLFLIGAMAFAIDLSNWYFSRQSAQTAADAACTAAAMDMLVGATNGSVPSNANFTPGTAFDCNSSTTAAPCKYAALNNFGSSIAHGAATSGTLGDNVYIDFPAASSYVCRDGTNCLKNLNLPASSVTANPIVRVAVTDNIPTWFGGMLKGLTQQGTRATSICAVENATSPIPILVLDPRNDPGTLHMNGGGSSSNTTGDIQIVGGPTKSIQVNSSSTTAVAFNGGPTINLCGGGPTNCGSSLGVWGGEAAPGTNFWTSSSQCASPHNIYCTGTQTSPQWNSPSPPIADPLATTPAPAQPTFATYVATNGTGVLYNQFGCPDPGGCRRFSPGYYPNGIDVHLFTAIFDPGLYYLGAVNTCNNAGAKGALCERSGSCMRPSNQVGDGSGGVMFYFAGAQSVNVGGGGGSCAGVDAFNTSTGALGLGVKCTAASQIPGNLPGTLTGSVLLAPCSAPDLTKGLCAPNCGLNFGDPLGTNDPIGEQRGILFFQNRAANAGNNPSWSGNGSMLLAGTMYFHQCVTSGSDTGQGCSSASAYNDQLGLGGTTGSSTYVLGDIIIDQLSVGGSGKIVMDLNPSAAYVTLKAALVQ